MSATISQCNFVEKRLLGNIARSQIGKLSCLLHLSEGDILVALRSYLDSSGKLDSTYLTLAGFAGSDEIWTEFETEWDRILGGHTPPARYLHMWEVDHHEGEFSWDRGWTSENAYALVMKCLMYMSRLDKNRFRMFYCAVDLEARRRLVRESYQIPSPIELCNEYCTKIVFSWYLLNYPGVINPVRSIQYYFDQGEYFKAPFEEKWRAETKRSRELGVWNEWDSVIGITTAEMRSVPGIQAADILAWGVNKESTKRAGRYSEMANIMRQVISSYYMVFDEKKMRQEFRPLIYNP
jgi:hypothetical protein